LNSKQWLGVALLAWGSAGVLNQFFLHQALTSASAPTAALTKFDPATTLKITNPTGAGLTSPAMLADAGISAIGAWLLWG
jgi:hypothetical protein